MMEKCGLEHVEHENPYFFIYYKKYTYLIFYKKKYIVIAFLVFHVFQPL